MQHIRTYGVRLTEEVRYEGPNGTTNGIKSFRDYKVPSWKWNIIRIFIR